MTNALLVIPCGITNTALDIQLITLMNIFLNDLGKFPPQQYGMPVSTVRHLSTICQRIATLCRCQTHTSNCHTLINIAHFRFYTYITYQHYLVHNLTYIFLRT